jgi:hypothetical protein
MNTVERDRRAFQLAQRFLSSLDISGLTPEVLERYLGGDAPGCTPSTNIRDLYFRLIFHAQNANMRSGVIDKSIGGIERLSPVLFDFDARSVLGHYDSWETILDDIEIKLRPRGKLRREARSIWPSYCRTILSAARFIVQFQSAEDFHAWVRFFDKDERSRPALPLLLEREIHGYGFPLACDFLKELGYQDFSKPDVHIRDLFVGLALTSSPSDFDVFRAVARVANSAGVKPYRVDKVFWLIGSGNFYDNPEIGNQGRIGSHKAQFLELARPIVIASSSATTTTAS